MKSMTFAIAPMAMSVAMALNVAHATTSDEEDSVYQWGRWEVLAPAAGNQPAPVIPRQLSQLTTNDYEKDYTPIAPDEPDPLPIIDDEEEIVLPDPSCEAGASCGFATRNFGAEPGNGAEARFNTFATAGGDGGMTYVLNEGETGQLNSENMDNIKVEYPVYDPSRDTYYTILRSRDGVRGAPRSTYTAKDYAPYPMSEVSQAGDWFFRTGDGEGMESGFFAWGDALPQDVLDELNAGSVLAEFSGPMASGLTDVNLAVQFGSDAFWEGAWSGAHNFQAAGNVVGPSLVQTSITNAEGLVEGFVAGNAEDMRAVMKVDVITDNGVYKDVGSIPRDILEVLD